MTFRVTCPDGKVRHEDFCDRTEAERWADNHACLANHEIELIPTTSLPSSIERRFLLGEIPLSPSPEAA